jgi:translation initiation factor IF-3
LVAIVKNQKITNQKRFKEEYRLNERIVTREIRLIGSKGEQLGIMSPAQGLLLAQEKGLDLAELSPNAKPPVCRLVNYDKFRYQQTKKEKDAKKAHKLVLVREIKFRPRIGEHDKQAKLRIIRKFLIEGKKVKISVVFRGREITHQDIGVNLLRNITKELGGETKLESPPRLEGRSLSLTLAPDQKQEVPKKPLDSEKKIASKTEKVQT